MAFASISILSFDIRSSHLSASLPLLINKWPRGWLLLLRYIQTWVVISNIWSGCKCSTTKCMLVVIVKLRDIIMIYFYQIWHLIFCRETIFQILSVMTSYFIWMEVSCRIQWGHYTQLYMYPISFFHIRRVGTNVCSAVTIRLLGYGKEHAEQNI